MDQNSTIRAKIHGSAYRMQRIGTCGSREFVLTSSVFPRLLRMPKILTSSKLAPNKVAPCLACKVIPWHLAKSPPDRLALGLYKVPPSKVTTKQSHPQAKSPPDVI